MGNVEVTAIFKYAWSLLVPVLMKGWSMIDNRFKETEKRVERVSKEISEIKTEVKVITAKLENQEKVAQDQSDKIDKLMDLFVGFLKDNK